MKNFIHFLWQFQFVHLAFMVAVFGCQPREKIDSTPRQSKTPISPFVVPVPPALRTSQEPTENRVHFRQVHDPCGLQHVYLNGQAGRSLIVETIGGGCGWLDYDNDGRWDLVINQGGNPTTTQPASQPLDKLFRNIDSKRFADVSSASRIIEPHYSQAVSVGDFDNDGFDDFYVSNVRANTLWHNCGDGTFQEVAQSHGVADSRWSASSAWADLDLDGDLDLYVCNYTKFDPTNPIVCHDNHGQIRLCSPGELEPVADACYMNQGNGTFVDEASQRGLSGAGNRALGVAVADFNNDGLPDIYVANDSTENFLFVNQGAARFKNLATSLGCAVDREGNPQASMGIAVRDFDHNGYLDIYCTNYFEESNTLYANYGERGFQDVTASMNLHRPTLAFLGFGTVIEDFDADGRAEMLIANGHVDNSPSNQNLKMKAQLFTYHSRRWLPIESTAGDYFQLTRMGRGVALCDYDDDGDMDFAVVNQNDPTALLQNESKTNNWLQVRCQGVVSNRRGIGCRITVVVNEKSEIAEFCGGTSYASSHQPTCHFGLGSHSKVDLVRIHWPTGKVQEIQDISSNQILIVEEIQN